MKARLSALYSWLDQQVHRLPAVPRNLAVTGFFLWAAFWASNFLIQLTGEENNSALVFVLAVVLISLLTTGYIYGIAASIVGAVSINIYFMAPFAQFSLSRAGYPVATLSMVFISCVVCALTARVKKQATEAVRREKKAKALYEQNERLNAEKAAIQRQSDRETIRGNILRAVSHDLRTPLTAICGYLDLLEGEEKSEAAERYLSLIRGRTDHLRSLTEEFFRTSAVLAAEEPEPAEPVSLNRAVEESLAAWYGVFSARGIAPEVELPETPVVRPLNREAVSRILSNVLSNAAKYSPGDLRIVLEKDGTLTFSNAAPSLTPVLAEQLFDRYFTVESGGQGTGLGLSIARRLTEQMGGTAAAGWQAGILTVRLYFPEK